MSNGPAGKDAGDGSARFRRHRPEQPLLYRLIEQCYPLRYLFASQPKIMGKALGIVYHSIATQPTRLAALVPKPRVNLTRYHGVFAPNNKDRVWATPARRGKDNWIVAADQDEKTRAQRHVAMS